MLQSNYEKYRGKCKEFCDEAVKADSTLRLVRGNYWCPLSNKEEPHWWTVKDDGTIYDPTKLQFLSAGAGTYTEFDGFVDCEECGEKVAEENIKFAGRHTLCSEKCRLRLYGL